jgi:mono/diheme cytochrome c family protein
MKAMTIQRSVSAFAILLGCILLVSGCRSAVFVGCRRPSLTPQEVEGKHLYEARCAHCHQDNDLELKKAPPDLHGIFRSAELPSGASATDANVRNVVVAGKGMMPAFNGRFDDAQMAALLAYLHTGLR